MSETVVLVSYHALPERAEMARRELEDLIGTVQATEPDCGGITLFQGSNDATRFTLIERWPSQEIFLGRHMQEPHIRSFIERAGAFLAGPPDISFWQG
jgi:quinol monooxygenase YgiN